MNSETACRPLYELRQPQLEWMSRLSAGFLLDIHDYTEEDDGF